MCRNTPTEQSGGKEKSLSPRIWGGTVLADTYLINCLPSKVLENHSSINTLSKHFPYVVSICSLPPKVFNCVAFVQIHKIKDPNWTLEQNDTFLLDILPSKKVTNAMIPLMREWLCL